MKFELRSIGYWSVVKVGFILNLVVGLCFGFIFALFVGGMMTIMSEFGGMSGMPMLEEDIPSVGVLIILYPFLFGFVGAVLNTIFALIAAFVYNMIARLVGGIEFELKQQEMTPVATYQTSPSQYAAQSPQAQAPPPPPPPPSVEPLPPDVQPPEEGTDSGKPQV